MSTQKFTLEAHEDFMEWLTKAKPIRAVARAFDTKRPEASFCASEVLGRALAVVLDRGGGLSMVTKDAGA